MEYVFALNVPTVTRVVYYNYVVHSSITMINLVLLQPVFLGVGGLLYPVTIHVASDYTQLFSQQLIKQLFH